MRTNWLWMIVVIGCGGTKPAPEPKPDPTPPAASEPAAKPAEQPVLRPEVGERAEPSGDIPIDPGCRGAKLDLAKMNANGRCYAHRAVVMEIPPEIRVAIEPAELKVKSGQTTRASIVLANTTDKAVTLQLDDKCGELLAPPQTTILKDGEEVRIVDKNGLPYGCPDGASACSTSVVLFEIEARGEARLDFTVLGKVQGPDCKVSKPAPKGTYELHVSSPLVDAKVPLVIQ